MFGNKDAVSVRAYRITTLSLGLAVVWLGWKYWSLSGQVLTGAFVSYQAFSLRQDVEDASTDRERILYDLDWYLGYYDHQTNTLSRSPVLGFLRIERAYLVRDAIACLRKTSTNDFGDDPYEWLRHEYKR